MTLYVKKASKVLNGFRTLINSSYIIFLLFFFFLFSGHHKDRKIEQDEWRDRRIQESSELLTVGTLVPSTILVVGSSVTYPSRQNLGGFSELWSLNSDELDRSWGTF